MDDAARGIFVNRFECLEIRAGTDRVGSSASNMALSARRAETVRRALVERGVRAKWMTLKPLGETEPIVATADGVPEEQNRYAMIIPMCRAADWVPPSHPPSTR